MTFVSVPFQILFVRVLLFFMNLDFCWAREKLRNSIITLASFFHTKHCWHTKSFWSNPLLLYFSWQIALHASPPSHFMLFGARNPYVFYIVSAESYCCLVVFQQSNYQHRETTRDINNIPIKYPEGPTTFSHLLLLLCCSFELIKLGPSLCFSWTFWLESI